MKYSNFDIHADNVAVLEECIEFNARVFDSPCGQMNESQPCRLFLTDVDDGYALFDALFHGDAGVLLMRSRDAVSSGDRLRIRLHLHPALQDIPWEKMCCNIAGGERNAADRLTLNRQYSIVRYIDIKEKTEPVMLPPSASALFTTASPDDDRLTPLQTSLAHRIFEEECRSVPELTPQSVMNVSRTDLLEYLEECKPSLFIFYGHGYFPGNLEKDRNGCIYLRREGGGAQRADAEELSGWLRNAGAKIAVFISCSTACGDTKHHWYGIGPALVKSGVAAIIAMQSTISEQSGLMAIRRFLHSIPESVYIDEIVSSIRQMLSLEENSDWSAPVLFLRDGTGKLFDDNRCRDHLKNAEKCSSSTPKSTMSGSISNKFNKCKIGNVIISDTVTIDTINN